MKDSRYLGKISLVEGEDALLTCVARNVGNNTVLWKKPNGKKLPQVLTAGTSRVSSDNRIKVIHDDGR